MKDLILKYGGWVLAIIAIIVLIFSLDKCNAIKSQSKTDTEFLKKQREGTLDSFKVLKTSSGQTIAYQQQVLASKDAVIGNLISEKELKEKHISKLDQQLSAVQNIIAANVLIPFKDTADIHHIIVVKDSVPHLVSCLTVPLAFDKSNQWMILKGVVDTFGIRADSIGFISKPKFTIGLAKEPGFKNFMNPPKATVFFEDENPYAHTMSMRNITVKYQEKFYEKKWFWFILGNLTGFGATIGVSKAVK